MTSATLKIVLVITLNTYLTHPNPQLATLFSPSIHNPSCQTRIIQKVPPRTFV
ncbi:hypothetical protein PGTUg99_020085 [Puccinia graminis f. sp. tritici]|uniref:Uncharacterized protein n=1 Tax=Puccinia graminis f. sp. tritici TaxID=56615 RepID=A0A5B0QR04_PUCGR|nr:hypothetical protein PGTUg99_020085 [Puccinia graminis f. sp. tritici]